MAKHQDYDEFVEKFKPKLTTDDCYTPAPIYEALAGYVSERYRVDRAKMLRPFWPGGDYESDEYPDDHVVVDNPPFSVLSKIVKFYVARGVKFFLFAPTTSLFGMLRYAPDLCLIPAHAEVTYENGAVVRTSFATNLEPGCVIVDQELKKIVEGASDEVQKATRVKLPKYKMPDNVWNAARLGKLADHGVSLRIDAKDYQSISALDSQRAEKKAIFGGGLIFSDRVAQQLDEARRQADEARRQADEARQITWELSDRERAIIDRLNESGT